MKIETKCPSCGGKVVLEVPDNASQVQAVCVRPNDPVDGAVWDGMHEEAYGANELVFEPEEGMLPFP